MNENVVLPEAPRDTFSMDNRGYIHGGFDTPVFLKAKQKHNARVTRERNQAKQKKGS